MKQLIAQLLLLGILLYGGWLWLASPATEPTMPTMTAAPTWADTAWQFSKVALSFLPGLLVLAVGIAIISAPFLIGVCVATEPKTGLRPTWARGP